MTDTSTIKRHNGGTIDYRHYDNIGREMHGRAMRDAVINLITGILRMGRRKAMPPLKFSPGRAPTATLEHRLPRQTSIRRKAA